jgi:hypothetical protein
MIYKGGISKFFIIILLSSCATAPTTPAPWDATPAAIRQVFPDGEYIAQRGRGRTRAAAETNATAELARFISSQINANRGYQITTDNNTETVNTYDETYVKSQINLFGIRFADDAYYRKDIREWRTVAWIEREEAWAVYSPQFKRQADSFIALFDAAENERDAFRKYLQFNAANNYANSDAFTGASLFGQILDPRRMNEQFAPVRARTAAIPQRLEETRRNASVYIESNMDFESLILSAFTARFSALGFPVAGSANAAAAVCRVTVDEGMQQRQLGVFYFPKLQAVISGSSGVLFTFSAEGGQASAVTPDVAKRRAYQSLADEVNKRFTLNINTF